MRINENDLIEEIDAHMRRCGGECGEWCVGTAKDSEGLLRGRGAPDANVIYREAYTPYAAAEAAERLVGGYGLRADPGSAPGRIVYVYRAPVPAPAARPAPTATARCPAAPPLAVRDGSAFPTRGPTLQPHPPRAPFRERAGGRQGLISRPKAVAKWGEQQEPNARDFCRLPVSTLLAISPGKGPPRLAGVKRNSFGVGSSVRFRISGVDTPPLQGYCLLPQG